ncbi:MAG: DUF2442 domain-containing protein [Lachnospiraceae bacterium]|nr:DUF2442 domain-containing protein [Lachnospiraceae bacterium]
MPLIKSVKPYEDYKIAIELDNGHIIVLDMESKVDTIRFARLWNKECFNKVHTDGYSVIWDKARVSMSITEIFQMLRTAYAYGMVG